MAPSEAVAPVAHDLFAASFSGAKPDGQFSLAGDHLQLDGRLLEFFDYYLAALGERNLPEIRRQIELDNNLPSLAAAKAKKILGQYLAYRAALADIDQNRSAGTNVIDALRQ